MDYWTSGFLLCLTISFGATLGVMYYAAVRTYQTMGAEEAEEIGVDFKAQTESLTAQGIFVNNLVMSWFLIIPVVGMVPFIMVLYSTGRLLGALALVYNVQPSTLLMNITVMGFIELLAYSLLMAENMYISILILTGAGKERVKAYFKSIVVYAIVLFIAAILEVAMIGAGG